MSENTWGNPRLQVWLGRGAWSFLAVAQWLRRKTGHNPIVWVPDYFCSPSLVLLRRSGAKIVYYPVGENLCPSLSQIDCLMDSGHPDILVVVHYFGIPRNFNQMLSRLGGVPKLIIEDAAHALRPCSGVGSIGDVVLYCPHKHLGIPHGAVLVTRDSVMAQELEQELQSLGSSAPSVGRWYVRKALQKALPKSIPRLLRPVQIGEFWSDAPAPPVGDDCRMNSSVHTLLRFAKVDQVAKDRRQADSSLRTVLTQIGGWTPICDTWGDATPYRTVMRCKDEMTAGSRYSFFRSRGYPVETWGSLAEEVRTEKETHQEAHRLRKTILLFPFDSRDAEAGAELAQRILRQCKGMS